MEITEESAGPVLVVAMRGRLDGTTSKAAEERILKLIEEGRRALVVDLAQLDYISSVGLRVLMLAAKRLKSAGGAIVVCSLQPGIKQVFEIAGFTTIFRIFETRGEAIRQLGAA